MFGGTPWWRLLVAYASDKSAASPAGEERRVWVRHPADLRTTCQPAESDHSRLPTQVRNISATGIGLLVTHPVPIGALLNLTLQGSSGMLPRNLLACVVHVTTRSEGEWSLGCNFIRSLSDSDLQELFEPHLIASP